MPRFSRLAETAHFGIAPFERQYPQKQTRYTAASTIQRRSYKTIARSPIAPEIAAEILDSLLPSIGKDLYIARRKLPHQAPPLVPLAGSLIIIVLQIVFYRAPLGTATSTRLSIHLYKRHHIQEMHCNL